MLAFYFLFYSFFLFSFFFSFYFLIWGVSLTHLVLASFLCREFLSHIPYWLYVYLGSFSYTSHASFFLFSFLSVGSFSYTSRAGFISMQGVSLTRPELASFLCGEFLLHIPCCFKKNIYIYLGSFSDTFRAGFIFIRGVSLTHPMLAFFFLYFSFFFYSGEFLLHISCWLHFYAGSFSHISRTGFMLIWEVSLTHPMLPFHPPPHPLLWGVSLTHPVLASFLCREFLLYILSWLHFYAGSFSYTSRAGLILIWGVSLKHPVLA